MSDTTFPLGRFRKHLAYDTRVVADVALPYLDLCIGHLRVRPRGVRVGVGQCDCFAFVS